MQGGTQLPLHGAWLGLRAQGWEEAMGSENKDTGFN